MKFNKIDIETWNRRQTYTRFLTDAPCTYSICINLNITKLLRRVKKYNFKLFPVLLYGITCIVNRHLEFRTNFDEQGNIGFYDSLNPCYTIFHTETETFTNVWTEYDSSFQSFYHKYECDMKQYQNDIHNSKPIVDGNIFNVSCMPWTTFTGFNLNLQKGYDYLTPIFTIGKYFSDDEKILLPLAIQVHHAVCDGFHTARFINELQELVDTLVVENE